MYHAVPEFAKTRAPVGSTQYTSNLAAQGEWPTIYHDQIPTMSRELKRGTAMKFWKRRKPLATMNGV
jgi:hypothetical protein